MRTGITLNALENDLGEAAGGGAIIQALRGKHFNTKSS